MKMLIALAAFACAVGAANASDLLPDSVLVEAMHVSHLTQHEPFTNDPTNYGYDAVSLVAGWNIAKNWRVQLSEGMILEGSDDGCTGGLWGPREVFTARVQYVLWRR